MFFSFETSAPPAVPEIMLYSNDDPLLLHQSGTVTVFSHCRLVGLSTRRAPSSVALKVTPCGQWGQETANEAMLKFSCREVLPTSAT